MRISIHAPVKGATPLRRPHDARGLISIHAPVKGATRQRAELPKRYRDFNPRSREGSDFKPRWTMQATPEFQSTLP